MLRQLIFIFYMLSCHCVLSQTYSHFRTQAQHAGVEKNFHQATHLYRQAFLIHPLNSKDFYEAACFASQTDNANQAFEWLAQAIQLGYQNIEHLSQDTDLLKLHTDSRWRALISSLSQKIALMESNYNKPLQKELLQIFEDDQNIRNQAVDAFKKYGKNSPKLQALEEVMIKIDQVNLKKVIAIIDAHGWLAPHQVGKRASDTLFLVIQHADLHVQKQYLPLVRDALKQPTFPDKSWLAYLEDRIAIREGRKQMYGTQLWGENGQLDYTSLEDPDHIDELRARLGLPLIPDSLKPPHIALPTNLQK